MVLSLDDLVFVAKDAECIYEAKGVQWVLWFNGKAFMVTATRDDIETYRNIFEDFDSLMTEALFDNDVRRLVSCMPDLIRPYKLKEDETIN